MQFFVTDRELKIYVLQFNITIGLELHNDQQLEIIKS